MYAAEIFLIKVIFLITGNCKSYRKNGFIVFNQLFI